MNVFPVEASLLGYLVTAALAVGVDVWVRRHGRGSAATWFRLPLYGTAMWALGSALQLSVAGEATKTLVMQLWTVAAWSVPLGWFVFVLHYTGSTHLLTREVEAGLVGLFAALTGLTLTNQYHGLLWSDVRLVTDLYAVPVLVVERTSVYWAGLTIEYLLGGITVLLLAKLLLTARRVGRSQVAALVAGVVLPIVLNTVSVATDQYVPALNLTPVGAGMLLVFVGWALFRYQLFGIEPLARAEVLEVIDEGVVIVDETGRVVDFNDRATSLFPDLDGAFGEPLAATVPALLADEATESPTFVDSLVVETADGERSISVSVSELAVNADSRAEVVVCQDVTELDAYARELEQRTEQLDRFAETVSHDLRNPLSVLQGRLELIRETGDPSHAEAAADAADRMNTIIDDVLTLARQDHALGETEPVGLAAVATEAWGTTDTGDAELRIDATEDDTVVADAARLRTALENLYRNAIEHGSPAASTDATDTGDGAVTRSSRTSGASTDEASLTVTVGTIPDGFYVADDGAGIPEDDRDTLFEYGYTTTSDGTGFGLAIVDEVAQAHDWSVEVESSASGGARFTFSDVAEKND